MNKTREYKGYSIYRTDYGFQAYLDGKLVVSERTTEQEIEDEIEDLILGQALEETRVARVEIKIDYRFKLIKYLNTAGLILTSENHIIGGSNKKIDTVLAGFEKKYNCKVEMSVELIDGEYMNVMKGIVNNA